MEKIITFDKIIKSVNDKRKYDTVTLNNGLRVIVINDPDAGNSAAALSVSVGSLQNKYIPYKTSFNEVKYEEINGLAHFLEHMLFMGSKKYPDETLYSKIISKYGGISNAYTDMNHTCYYFSSTPNSFEKILDVFGQFFIDPLFNESAIMREMNSVQEEHNKNYNIDSWRELQVLRNISKRDHIWNGFATGSLDCLNIKDIQKKLKNFFKGYYCPQNMYLILYSTHSTNNLLSMADKIFSLIPFRKPLTIPINNQSLPYECHKVVCIAPIHTKNCIKIVWQIPNLNLYVVKYRNYNPMNFIAYIIGQKTKGSIYEYLRKKNLATNLIIEPLQYINDIFLFSIEIYLTPKGFKCINYIINLIYEYIDMLQDNSILNLNKIKDIYNEIRFIKQQDILYQEKEDTLEYVKNIADKLSLLPNLPVEEVLIVGELLSKYCSDFNRILKGILEHFRKDNSIVLIISKKYEGILIERDPWYNCEYQIYDKIPCDTKQIGKKINLSLPDKNRFICRNNKLITEIKPYKNPVNIKSFKYYELWYQFTNQFNIPYVNIVLNLTLPKLKKAISLYIAFKIYLDCIIDEINADLYECNISNYEIQLLLTQFNLTIVINGPCEKIGDVVDMLISSILNLNINIKTFLKIKTRLNENLVNNIYIAPYENTFQELLHNIEYNYYITKDMLKDIANVGYENILNIKDLIFSKMLVKGIITGNILLKDAIKIANKFKYFTSNNRINYDKIKLIKELKPGSRINIKAMSDNSKEFNSAIGMFYSIDYVRPTISENNWESWNYKICLCNLIHSIIGSEYINELRSKEQLGYIVTSDLIYLGSEANPLLCYAFIIQSSSKDCDYLVSRTEQFIENIREIIINEKKEDLLDRKKSLIKLLSRPPENLKSFTSKNLNKAFNTDNVMDLEEILISTYKTITIRDLLRFYDNYIYGKKTRRVWIVQIN